MNNIAVAETTSTITSLKLREIINAARSSQGGKPVRNDDLLRRIEDELDGERPTTKISAHPQSGVEMRYYDLTMSQAVQILTRENQAARRMLSESITDHMEVLKAYQNIDVTELESDKYIYVIKNATTGAYKVGISKDPEQRLKALQVGNDCELRLIGYKQGTFQDENAAHQRLADKNIRSEWFNLDSNDVQALIN